MTEKLVIESQGDLWAAVCECRQIIYIVRKSRSEVASYVEGWNDAIEYAEGSHD